MDLMTLINQLSDPVAVSTMPVGDKLIAGLMVTLIGMTITFIALVLLWVAILIMTKVLVKTPKPAVAVVERTEPQHAAKPQVQEENDDELVAVITAAIAASLKTSIHNIVVTNIVRVQDETPAWANKGRMDQMNARF